MTEVKETIREFIEELSIRLADEPDYDDYWQPRLKKLYKMFRYDEIIKDNVEARQNCWIDGGEDD